jgi:hypothetical protein
MEFLLLLRNGLLLVPLLFILNAVTSNDNLFAQDSYMDEYEDIPNNNTESTKTTTRKKYLENTNIVSDEAGSSELIYETESDDTSDAPSNPTIDMSPEQLKKIINELRMYRSFSINDVKVSLNDIDDRDTDPIRVFYKDDLQFECDLPEEKYKGSYDWSLNGHYMCLNESGYSLILDKNIEKNLTQLNFSCYFESTEIGRVVSLPFPTLIIGLIYL